MVKAQIISKILATKDLSIIHQNGFTSEHFIGYEDEFNFILNHFEKYNSVPDITTFLESFNDFEIIDVKESERYLIETLDEEYLYFKSVPILKSAADLLKNDAREAYNYLKSELPLLNMKSTITAIDIIKQGQERLKEYENKKKDDKMFIASGFEELDTIIKGWNRGEELVLLFGRSGQGKSWVSIKMLEHAWKMGETVGFISPEMGANKVGYRFDTIHKNYSNKDLIWGNDVDDYSNYIKDLSNQTKSFYVARPKDFQNKLTITKLKAFCEQYKITILGIDGIMCLADERNKKGDNETIRLTNIAEDLMTLSIDLQIPILIVTQSNRQGVKSAEEEGTPDLDHVRSSDGLVHNASKVIAIRQKEEALEFGLKKHRDGRTGGKLCYYWNADIGQFDYIPDIDDDVDTVVKSKKIEKIKKTYKEGADVF